MIEAIDIETLKFPIGEFTPSEIISETELRLWISTIKEFPQKLNETLKGLSDEQLNWIYRPEGWNIRQVVFHCADSHMNSFIRFKLALTEDKPNIRPYFEDRWAEQKDYQEPLNDALLILEGLHSRWSKFLSGLTSEELSREFVHPEHGKVFRLDWNVGFYAWHCDHHLAHIKQALKYKGEF